MMAMMNLNVRAMSVIKNILSLFIPPIAFKVLSRRKKPIGTDKITYEGLFDSFEAVIKSYGNQPQYSTELAQAQSLKNLRLLINLYNSKIDFVPSWSSTRFNFISSFVSGLDINDIGVLDIGGGYGETYLHLKQATIKRFKYRVFDLPFVISQSKPELLEFEEIKFCQSLDDVDIVPHIVYFGSSLQYFNDYKNILSEAMSYKPLFIVVSDTPMGNIDTFACAQVNMPGIVIPRWVFNQNEISLILKTEGYELIHDSANFYPFHNFNNYALNYKDIAHKNTIFIKKNQG
jgi:putative methyltransferase (TIGR04325 family)